MKTNYHTHTSRCRHAEGTDEEYVLSAIENGFTTLGFSDHCPFFFKSTNRMLPEEFPNYILSLTDLKEKYKKRISILKGLECEYSSEIDLTIKTFYDDSNIDYLLFGNHYPSDDFDGLDYFEMEKTKENLDRYLRDSLNGLNTGYFVVFAHPDFFFEDYIQIDNEVEMASYQICKTAIKNNVILEFNVRANTKMPDVGTSKDIFWKTVARMNNKVILGIDAHDPKDFANSKLIQSAKEYLANIGITNVVENI